MAEFASKLALAIFRLNEVVETEKTPLYLSNFDTGLEITIIMNKTSKTEVLQLPSATHVNLNKVIN